MATQTKGGLGGSYARRKVAELAADPANARKHNDKNLAAIKASLQRFGQQKPIVVDSSGIVRAGNGTLAAAQALGWTEIDCVVSDLSGAEATAYAIADNRTAELAEWDDAVLTATLQALEAEDASLLLDAGFDEKELAKLVAQNSPDVVEDEVPEPPADPITQPGDLWLLGEHRLLCGDSTKAEDVARVVDGEKLGSMLTDPPYGIAVVGRNGKIGADKLAKTNTYRPVHGDDRPFDPAHLIEAAPVVVLWGANHYADKLPPSSGWVVWDKREGMTSNAFADVELAWTNQSRPARLFAHMWSGMIKKGESERRCHPTQKPLALMAWLMREYGTDGIVGDWYLGSGTTLIAAEQLGRKCYGLEIDPGYCDVIVARWEKLTGKKAERVPA